MTTKNQNQYISKVRSLLIQTYFNFENFSFVGQGHSVHINPCPIYRILLYIFEQVVKSTGCSISMQLFLYFSKQVISVSAGVTCLCPARPNWTAIMGDSIKINLDVYLIGFSCN